MYSYVDLFIIFEKSRSNRKCKAIIRLVQKSSIQKSVDLNFIFDFD